MARLWKVIGGEPFMVNPQLGILGAMNPRKKRKVKMARGRKWGKSHMAWVRSHRRNPRGTRIRRRTRRRGYRRNPYPIAGLVANPRRRRRYRSNPRRRRGQRNPRLFGFTLPPLMQAAYVGVGFVGTPIAEGFLNQFLPVSITANTVGKYAVRVGTVIALTAAAKMFLGRAAAKMIGIGGGAYVLTSAVREFAPGVIPGLSGLGAYTGSAGARRALGAYEPARRQLGAPAYGASRAMSFAPQGAANVVAGRFRRFQ